jgi:hypothetical protein
LLCVTTSIPPRIRRRPDAARKPPITGYGMKRSHWPSFSAPTEKRNTPTRNALTDRATSTLMMISCCVAPLAIIPAATDPATTLMTATVGESGPPTTGEKEEVSEITRQVSAAPIIRPARPRGKPLARSPVKMRAAKEMQ